MKTKTIISIIIAVIIGIVGLVGYKMFGKPSNPPTIEEAKKYGCFSMYENGQKMANENVKKQGIKNANMGEVIVKKTDGYGDSKQYTMQILIEMSKDVMNSERISFPLPLVFEKSEKGWNSPLCIIPR
jgi:hypothetical protein